MTVVTCRLVVVGLVILAVFLPLAIAPPAIFVQGAPLAAATVALESPVHPPVAPLLAAGFLRAPPSR